MAAPASSKQTLTTVTLWDYEYAPDGTALSHIDVEVELQYNQATLSSPAVILENVKQKATTDSNGQWSVNIVQNSAISPANTVYTVKTPYRAFQVSVPSGAGPFQASSYIQSSSSIPANPTSIPGPLTLQNGPLTVQGDIAARSLTLSPSSPYNSTAPAGGLVARNIGGDRYADQFSGANVAAQIAAAATDLGNDQGLIIVPAGITGMVAPNAPTVTVTGAAGTTPYNYFVIAINAAGDAVASAFTTITNGNATLNSSNYNAVSWGSVTGATSYKLVRGRGGATQGVIVTQAGTSYNDQGATAVTYSYPSSNLTTLPENVTVLDLRNLPCDQAGATITRADALTNINQSGPFHLTQAFGAGGGNANNSVLAIDGRLTGGGGATTADQGAAVGLYAGMQRDAGTRGAWGANILISTGVAPTANMSTYGIEVDVNNNSGSNATLSTIMDGIAVLAAGSNNSRFGIWLANSGTAKWWDALHIGNIFTNSGIEIDPTATTGYGIYCQSPSVFTGNLWGDIISVPGAVTVTKQAAPNVRLGVLSSAASVILDNQSGQNLWAMANIAGVLSFYIDGSGNTRLTLDTNGQVVTSAAPANNPLTLQHYSAASAPCLKLGSNVLTATSATAGANGAVPAQVKGYIPIVWTDGTTAKIPVFAN